MNSFSAKLFPLGLIILLFGLSFWLDQISTLSSQNRTLDPEKPEYIVENATAKRFDTSGELKEILIAKKTWQLPNSDIIYTQSPFFDIFEAGVKKYHLEGDEAQYNQRNKVIYFANAVELIKMPEGNQPEATLKTTQLTADTIQQTVQSKSRVDFTYGASTGHAVGFNYNHKTGALILQSRVSATYEIPKNN